MLNPAQQQTKNMRGIVVLVKKVASVFEEISRSVDASFLAYHEKNADFGSNEEIASSTTTTNTTYDKFCFIFHELMRSPTDLPRKRRSFFPNLPEILLIVLFIMTLISGFS